MILKIKGYETPIELSNDRANLLAFNEIDLLFKFQNSVSALIDGNDGDCDIFNDDKLVNFETEVELISDVLGVSLNSKKTISHLYKKICKEVGASDQILVLHEIQERIKDFLLSVRKEMLISYSFNDDVGVDKLLKLYDVKYIEDDSSLLNQLRKYLELLIETTKVKIVFFTSALYYFDDSELVFIINFCMQNDLIVVFLEKIIQKEKGICKYFNIIEMNLIL